MQLVPKTDGAQRGEKIISMRFDKKFFEEQGQIIEDPESSVEKLIPFIKEISDNLKKEGVPVGEDCRINMREFSNLYGAEEIEKDGDKIKIYEKEWYEGSSEKIAKEKQNEKDGEKLEILTTILFSKFLKDKFIVARSSRYDDIFNGVDTVILEKETGRLVCALDEVADTSGSNLQDKIKNITEKNKKGSKLKYGLKTENGKPAKGAVEGAPIFYLALPKERINDGIKNLSVSTEKTDYEKKLFKYFIDLIQLQYSAFRLEKDINKDKGETFKIVLEKFKESR